MSSRPPSDLTVVVAADQTDEVLRRTVLSLVQAVRSEGATIDVVEITQAHHRRSVDTTPPANRWLPNEIGYHVLTVASEGQAGRGAVLQAIAETATSRYIAFLDGAACLPARIVAAAVAPKRRLPPDIILGSTGNRRNCLISDSPSSPVRWLSQWAWPRLAWLLFGVQFPAPSTTFWPVQLVRQDVLTSVLPLIDPRHGAPDLEMVVGARRLGYRRITSEPVDHIRTELLPDAELLPDTRWLPPAGWIPDSQLDPSPISTARQARPGTLLPVLTVFYRLRLLHHYDGHGHRDANNHPSEPTVALGDATL